MVGRILVMIAFAASAANAQAVPADSALQVLMHRDSTSRLTLTTRTVVYEFTDRGVAEEARRADSTTARYGDRWLANVVRESLVGAFRGLRVPIPIVDIGSVDVDGVTIRITSASRPGANRDESTFEFDATDAEAARAFVARLDELLRRR